ncbi:MAG: hypothetical protein CMJ83_20065 [Planctomycetes bacterium]|nr:hypothetical protein [Planctomycetota bacterium]
MQINRGTEYAIRAALFLARQKADTPVMLAAVAEAIGAPANYLSNILQALARFQIVQSHRGARRGYTLARPRSEIDLLQITEALEGPLAVNCCSTSQEGACPMSEGCPITAVFDDLQSYIRDRLASARLDVLLGPGRAEQ